MPEHLKLFGISILELCTKSGGQPKKEMSFTPLEQRPTNSSIKDKTVNILKFVGRVAATQLSCWLCKSRHRQ